MKSCYAIITAIAGLILAAVGLTGLTGSREDALRHDRNPFALYGSGYGKLLAQLSQDTINKVWHIGVEQVNPDDHHHGENDHDHGHCDHDHGAVGENHGLEPAHHEDDHAHHDQGHAHDDHDHGHDAHGHGHAPDDHGHGHESEHESLAALEPGLITVAKDWLSDLKNTRYERTNSKAMSEAHRLTVAGDIEEMLLRSYKMDPTDYGVYNGYFLFLTVHHLRATPRARDHARVVSRNTIAAASREDTDPGPWMTAAMAVLNLFFLDQEDCRDRSELTPAEMVRGYRQQMAHCLRQFAVLRQKAVYEKRWDTIPVERREAMEEREQFAQRAFEQFDAMLARHDATIRGSERTETEPAAAETPVVENSRSEGAG